VSRATKWLFTVAVATLLITIAIFAILRAKRIDAEARAREHQLRNEKEFEKVKAGSKDALVFSPDLIVMLANDAECIRNLENVQLFGDDLATPGYEQIQKLSNIHHISFDESYGVDAILPVVKDMPSVDSLYFYCVAMTDKIQSQLAAIPTLKKLRHGSIERKDAEALARKLPKVIVEVDDDASGEPIRVLPGSP
jgi:hypothetical protein